MEQPAGTTIHTFGYDGSGNMTSRAIQGQTAQTLLYDHDSRLERITKGTEVTGFLYDADGGRVKQMVGTASSWTTTILYGGGLFEQTGSTATKWYGFGGGMLAFRQGSTLHYLIDDHLASTSLTYTHSTDVAKKQLYYPFGGIRYPTIPDVPTTRGFTGQRRDASGLMFYQSRYYDPLIGRFTQPDTIIPNPANPQDFNRYSYVLNNPILYSDPSGMCPTNSAQAAACYAAAWYAAGNMVYDAFYPQPGHTVRAMWNWKTGETRYSLDGSSFQAPADFGSETARLIIANAFLWDAAHAKVIAAGDNPEGWTHWMGNLQKLHAENLDDWSMYTNLSAFGVAYGLIYAQPAATPVVASGSPMSPSEVARAIDYDRLGLSGTVRAHADDLVKTGRFAGDLSRPYLSSRLLIEEITGARNPVADPGGLANGWRWDVPGTFRGASGTWQLVVNLDTNQIVHFVFVS